MGRLKPRGERKSRLSERLSVSERDALCERWLVHVVGRLESEPRVSRLILLTAGRPDGALEWRRDEKRGLNAELSAVRADISPCNFLVIQADLPLLRVEEIARLLDAAQRSGAAIAPDRHGVGTNAIALAAGQPLAFAFGEGSFERHKSQMAHAEIVKCRGLALDIDTPADLALALDLGGANLGGD